MRLNCCSGFFTDTNRFSFLKEPLFNFGQKNHDIIFYDKKNDKNSIVFSKFNGAKKASDLKTADLSAENSQKTEKQVFKLVLNAKRGSKKQEGTFDTFFVDKCFSRVKAIAYENLLSENFFANNKISI
jgi:hypothetical protein